MEQQKMVKRIVLVHGRATKPRKPEKLRLIKTALIHGLERVSSKAASKVKNGNINLDLAYYGDINNAIQWAHQQQPSKKIVTDFLTAWGFPFEKNGSYDKSLSELLSWPTSRQNRINYLELRARVDDLGFVDNILDVVSPIVDFTGLNDELINSWLPDVGYYFSYRIIGSMIRERLQKVLIPQLKKDYHVCLISHSLGTVVAYDVLWKISRMSEYTKLHQKKIDLFLTLGSPLGDPVIQKQLYDNNEPEDGRYPANIREWKNFSAKDDFISHDEKLADNFREMVDRRLVSRITDQFIYNFWVGDDGLNSHKLYGYLDNFKVAKVIANWIEN
jgi:hypothetical protein